MARARSETNAVSKLTEGAIEEALAASLESGSIKAFYPVVGMRNPSRSYFVRRGGRLHSLKAIVTYALQQVRPAATARDFHAMDGAARLRELHFDVVHEPTKKEEERERVWVERLSRKRQAKFRERLIDLYGRCPLSGCTTLRALEAAHVDPITNNGIDADNNGILLRADLHKLFDADLLAINPADGRVHIAPSCKADYGRFARGLVFVPPPGGPDLLKFDGRWEAFRAAASN